MYTKDVIDLIKQSASLWDYLVKDGKAYGSSPTIPRQVKCTFHGDGSDARPSARYFPDNDSIKCFACDKVYDIIEYVRNEKGLSFSDTITLLLIKIGRTDLLERETFTFDEEIRKPITDKHVLEIGGIQVPYTGIPMEKLKKLLVIQDVWEELSDAQREKIRSKILLENTFVTTS